jgi:hypothetical protein
METKEYSWRVREHVRRPKRSLGEPESKETKEKSW